MHKLKMEFMPEATQKNFARLKDNAKMAGFTLVGGTALALQIGHRVRETLIKSTFFGEPAQLCDAGLGKSKGWPSFLCHKILRFY